MSGLRGSVHIIRTLSATQPTSAQSPLVVEASSVSSSPGSVSASTHVGSSSASGPARQHSGYRGRKAQKQRLAAAASHAQGARAIRPMNWSETVGQPPTTPAREAGQQEQQGKQPGEEP